MRRGSIKFHESQRKTSTELHWSMFTFNHHQHTIHFLRLQLDVLPMRIPPFLHLFKELHEYMRSENFYSLSCLKFHKSIKPSFIQEFSFTFSKNSSRKSCGNVVIPNVDSSMQCERCFLYCKSVALV